METESEMVVARDWGEVELKGYEAAVWEDDKSSGNGRW